MKEKVVGIMGGMGPEACIDLFARIVEKTHAKHDEDHLRIIVDNNPKMPSRQEAILNGGESPVPAMIATGLNLKNAGADFIIIGANTAHYFYDEVSAGVGIPFLNIIDEAVKETIRLVPGIKKVGVLASSASMKARLFEKSCDKFNMEVVPVREDIQQDVQGCIFDSEYGFKYNGLNDECVRRITNCANYLIENGAQAVIMGCTEIPLMLKGAQFPVALIDPNDIIAEVAVKTAKNLI